jgi:ferrochelatase
MAYDAVLVVSFGGPEGPDDVVPFLANVTRGRGIPTERLAEVGAHYAHFGGVSPLNAENRGLVAALRELLASEGPDLPVYWGNRNWDPYLADAVAQMREDGVRHALAFVTSAYSSYSGCRQYRENLAAARLAAGSGAPAIDRIRQVHDHPAFVDCFVRAVLDALERLPAEERPLAHLVFTAHSLPTATAAASGPEGFRGAYVAQLEETARLVADGVARRTGRAHPASVAYQSRSGPPSQPWLEPDVSDHVDDLSSAGVRFERAATPGTDPAYVAMVRDLVLERVDPTVPRASAGRLGPAWDRCDPTCCLPTRGEPLPTVGGTGG